MAKSRKFRVQLRKNRSTRQRSGNLTRAVASDAEHTADAATSERISGKGDLTRKRMMSVPLPIGGGMLAGPAQPPDGTWRGQVLLVHGLESFVRDGIGTIVRCTTSRLLRTVLTEQRHPVAAGDWACVLGEPGDGPARGTIVSVESRRNSLCRWSRGRRHVIVANVDQTLIVGSAAMPDLKPALIDRFIVAAESSGIRPIICINKVDLIDPARLVPLAGVFARMGYPVVLCSTVSGVGLERLKHELTNRVTAIVGQSGVGKSSILNALDPVLDLPVAEVSRDNEKGRHTTTTARLIPHGRGGSFVDTPGIRQFQLWEIISAEVSAAFRDLRPLANRCRFPDCSHTHESGCAVKDAVADGLLDTRRWESCCHLAAHAENQPEDSDE